MDSKIFDILHPDARYVTPKPVINPETAPPFRTVAQFLARTLNPQHFGKVTLAYEPSHFAHEKWFIAFCIRRVNQFSGFIDFNHANTYLAEGIKGGGKSALLDNISARFPKIITMYMAGDDEGLADLRMYDYRNHPDVPPKIQENIGELERRLIVGPPGVDVKSSFDYITFDKLSLNDIENYDVIVAPTRLHRGTTLFQCGEKIINILQLRFPSTDKGEVFLKVLEAADIVYARIAVKGQKVDQAKAHLVYLVRKMRHHGVAMGMDFQYSNSMDLEVKTNGDYSFVKNMGSDRLPGQTAWMYGFTHPIGLMSLYQNEFVCKDKWGGLYAGWFKLPPWHKTPKENIYKSLDIQIEYSGPMAIDRPLPPDTVDIVVHNEIVKAFGLAKTFKGTERMLRQTGSPRDLKTVKNHVEMHVSKNCPCWRQGA